jgi:hypothetical protein
MKTLFSTVTVWALTVAASYGQYVNPRSMPAGSAEAAKAMQDFSNVTGTVYPYGMNERQYAEYKRRQAIYQKGFVTGASLFGVDKRWSGEDGKWAGTLLEKEPSDLTVGDWGCTAVLFRVIGKVGSTELLATSVYSSYLTRRPEPRVVLIRGLDTSKVTDGVQFILQHPVVIQGTYSYTAVSGGRDTVLVLERNESKLNEVAAATLKAAEAAQAQKDQQAKAKQKAAEAARAEKQRQAEKLAAVEKAHEEAKEAAKWRTWTDSSGTEIGEAKFSGVIAGQVKLIMRDGTTVKRPLTELSTEDREWITNRHK